MNNYAESQRKAAEFNDDHNEYLPSYDEEIRELRRAVCQCIHLVLCLADNEMDYQRSVFVADNARHNKLHKGYLTLLETMSSLQPPPAEPVDGVDARD